MLLEYFNYFSIKDSGSLEAMFSEDIVLKDWNIYVIGKANVIQAINNIFVSAETIMVTPISFFSNSDYSYAIQVKITTNRNSVINAFDVINFDSNGKISEILAFICENIY